MKTLPSATKKERGQSLLELAISLIILLMLLTGAVEFGLALFQYVTIRDAAQEGAVYGSIEPADTTGIQWRAVDAASDILQLNPTTDVAVVINGSACEGLTGSVPNSIQVIVTYNHPITYPFVAEMIGNKNIQLQGRATNTILRPTCNP